MLNFTSNVTETVDLVPFDEALREMQAGPPLNHRDRLWLTEGLPLALAAGLLGLLYFMI